MRLFSQSPYTQAISRFKDLPRLIDEPDNYKLELVKLMELSISEVVQNLPNGKNYILLADLFGLAALQVQFDSPALYEYFVSFASVIIEFWAASSVYDPNNRDGNSIHSHLDEMALNIKFWDLAKIAGVGKDVITSVFTYLSDDQNINIIRNSLLEPVKFGSTRLVLPKIITLATGFSREEMLKAALFQKYSHEIPLYAPTFKELNAMRVITGLEKYGITPNDFLLLFSQP